VPAVIAARLCLALLSDHTLEMQRQFPPNVRRALKLHEAPPFRPLTHRLMHQKRLPVMAAVEAMVLYLQRDSWRVSDIRSQLYELIKAHLVPGHIIIWNDQPSVTRLSDPAYVISVCYRRPRLLALHRQVPHVGIDDARVDRLLALGTEGVEGDSGVQQNGNRGDDQVQHSRVPFLLRSQFLTDATVSSPRVQNIVSITVTITYLALASTTYPSLKRQAMAEPSIADFPTLG
jgi:hypothetical protein